MYLCNMDVSAWYVCINARCKYENNVFSTVYSALTEFKKLNEFINTIHHGTQINSDSKEFFLKLSF